MTVVGIISFLIWCVIIGIVFYLGIAVLEALGIAVPPRIRQLLGVLLLLLVILWFLTGVMPPLLPH